MTKRIQVNALLDPVLHHRLEAHCKDRRAERSAVLRDALRKYLDFQDGGGDVAEIKRGLGDIAKDVAKTTEQYERLVETLATMVERRE